MWQAYGAQLARVLGALAEMDWNGVGRAAGYGWLKAYPAYPPPGSCVVSDVKCQRSFTMIQVLCISMYTFCRSRGSLKSFPSFDSPVNHWNTLEHGVMKWLKCECVLRSHWVLCNGCSQTMIRSSLEGTDWQKHMSNCPTDDSRLADARSKLLAMCKKYWKLKTNENHEACAAIGWAQVLCR